MSGFIRAMWVSVGKKAERLTYARYFLGHVPAVSPFQQRTLSTLSRSPSVQASTTSIRNTDGATNMFQCFTAQFLPWNQQSIRTKKRGTEYQPKFLKRLRTHGWVKRLSTRSGIEVILRRMLKGRKSLSH
ncbi:39S ribosomal protein L34, mitochondrial [Protopterus annectens]|uniref:39S ribosomal protein L34, mitochondrial n=1 Tax=Protopterus annectens TaxID=7888 RepID=UPI001CFACB37|nr:39S ribosomal protein L34, mitochondrial [Protopterus annectens]